MNLKNYKNLNKEIILIESELNLNLSHHDKLKLTLFLAKYANDTVVSLENQQENDEFIERFSFELKR